ncbi:hypothetical protein PRIC1_005864 [Phytophthora ramorum]
MASNILVSPKGPTSASPTQVDAPASAAHVPTDKIVPRQHRKTPPLSSLHNARPRKQKIRTYIRRKNEIEALTGEVQRLKKQLDGCGHRFEAVKQREALIQCETINQTMRDALRAQRLSFASTLSMLSQFLREKATDSFDVPTRLGADPSERRASLLRIKDDRLKVAHHFMLTSQQYLPSTEFCDQKKFQATNGDMVSMNFEVVPLPEVQSIRSIVNALQTFVYNIEISMSEAVGDITIREDDDDEKPGASVVQHRLVTKIGSLVQIEANNIAFGEYRPAGAADSEVALLVSDAVDADELFPYRPQTRIRQDMTTIIKLAWSNEGGKSVVVLIRWVCLRIRKSDVCLPPLVVDRIRNGVDKVGEAMLATARHTAAMTN